MKNGKKILSLLFAFFVFSLVGCGEAVEKKEREITVLIESGKDYGVDSPVRTIARGEDVSYRINVYNGCMIVSLDYEDYELERFDTYYRVTLKDVRYPTSVSVETSYEYVTYCGNGGQTERGEETVFLPFSTGHLRTNAARGTEIFAREGYLLVGWNTQADGKGERVGLGSRVEKRENLTLYACWKKCNSEEDFSYRKESGAAEITAYTGQGEECVVPRTIEGLPVKKIKQGAFAGAKVRSVYLPETLISVEKGAFSNAELEEITLFDGLSEISDESFSGCNRLTTLHINAATKPVYSGTYYDTFPDKADRLRSIADEKKIVLFSGSSGRFGYDSGKIERAFPDYKLVNMGVYAYTNALPQIRMIEAFLREGDVFLHAPEFDTIDTQFCVTNALDYHLFCMTESNYDLLSLLDLKEYTDVFDSLFEYLRARSGLEGKDYSISAKNFDEDGNPVQYETYNEYGDFIFERKNGEKDEMLRFLRADYTINAFPQWKVEALNAVYAELENAGVKVYFSYAPRNRSSLTKESTKEERQKTHAYLKCALAVPVISDIEDYLYSGIYFYEIDNHLTDEGVQIRTDRVIADLKEQFAK